MDILGNELCMNECDLCIVRCKQRDMWCIGNSRKKRFYRVSNSILKDIVERRRRLKILKSNLSKVNPEFKIKTAEFWESQLKILEDEFIGILARDRKYDCLLE